MNLLISESCISCGVCAEACPAAIITMENKTPTLKAERCIKCGHCEAVCPTNALTNDCLNHKSIKEIKNHPVLDPETAELFLRSRRSIRCFKDKMVTKEETEKLVNIGRYAQTGSNAQGVSYLVISSKEKMEALRQLTVDYFKNKPEPFYQMMYNVFSNADRDLVFRGAPMCIMALTEKSKVANARYALTYIELFAPSLKLGTCWAGYLEAFMAENTEELRSLLDIPENVVVGGALLYGYPKYKYHRVTDRNELHLEWR